MFYKVNLSYMYVCVLDILQIWLLSVCTVVFSANTLSETSVCHIMLSQHELAWACAKGLPPKKARLDWCNSSFGACAAPRAPCTSHLAFTAARHDFTIIQV